MFTVKNSPWDKSQCGWDITRLRQSGVPFPLNAEGGTMEGCVQLNRTSTGSISMLVAEHHWRSHSFLSPNPHAPLSTTALTPTPCRSRLPEVLGKQTDDVRSFMRHVALSRTWATENPHRPRLMSYLVTKPHAFSSTPWRTDLGSWGAERRESRGPGWVGGQNHWASRFWAALGRFLPGSQPDSQYPTSLTCRGTPLH